MAMPTVMPMAAVAAVVAAVAVAVAAADRVAAAGETERQRGGRTRTRTGRRGAAARCGIRLGLRGFAASGTGVRRPGPWRVGKVQSESEL